MDFDQIRQLVAVADEGTMSAAADALRMPQPTLSRSIRRLEEELGCTLFDRVGRRVTLNGTGAVAVDWARQLLRDERLMRDAVAAAARRATTLRVGTVAPAPLWKLTALLVERFPREALTSETLSQADIVRMVSNGSLDLGIVEDDGTEDPSGMDNPTAREGAVRSCPLMREQLSITLPPSHPLAAFKTLTTSQLAHETFLILSDIGFWRERVDRALPHATLIEQHDRTVFAQLAHTTPYCTFVSDAPFRGDPPAGRIIVPLDDPMGRAVFRLIVRADATGVAADLFDWVARRSS
ncbi:LysR family transcriptional regulator [Bifidobacterium sp. 64T4]|uniref:LysR family transcriptional regulator n=1 Tax=Bifidobacterium pongonis TaxID=2834432 RepID=UPI001C578D9F|nr:LysR family transcriptional regulator [Bifidobacterium pongonis]MBW3094769.1 LysR family transcriptional regulator [Bifidobacterium pongonis]